jgi:hypothetical protein
MPEFPVVNVWKDLKRNCSARKRDIEIQGGMDNDY